MLDLSTWPSFDSLSQITLGRLNKAADIRRFMSGDTLLQPGTRCTKLYFVLVGDARAKMIAKNGQEIWLADYHYGDFFGEASIVGGWADPPVVTAITDLTVASVPTRELMQMIANDGELATVILAHLAERMEVLTRRNYELAALGTTSRICAELLRRAEQPEIGDTRRIIRPAPVLSDIGLHISATRETVSRFVNKLRREGVIDKQPGAMVILDPEHLQDHVDFGE